MKSHWYVKSGFVKRRKWSRLAEVSECMVTSGTDCTEQQKRLEILFIRLRVCNELDCSSARRCSTLQTV
jgi:hypothetical protein